MKRLFFGLLVAGVALSASAFTNAKPAFATVYYNLGNGSYGLTPPNGTSCRPIDEHPCTIEFQGNISSTYPTFDYDELQDVSNDGGGTYNVDDQEGAWVTAR